MFSNQLNQFFSNDFGSIVRRPFLTSSAASSAILRQLINHCGFTRYSRTSLERLQIGTVVLWPLFSLNSSKSWRNDTTLFRASNLEMPANSPHNEVKLPFSSITCIRSKLCLFPTSKSVGSWAGVTFTAPKLNQHILDKQISHLAEYAFQLSLKFSAS